MGNSNSKNKNKYPRLSKSVWEGYRGIESAIDGFHFSSIKNINDDGIWDGNWNVQLYHQKSDDSSSTVFLNRFDFNPIRIEITIIENELTVHFMKDQNTRCNPVIWSKDEYVLDSSHKLVSINRRNDVVSAKSRAIVVASDVRSYQDFSQCGPLKEPTTFSGMRHVFTVSDDSSSMFYYWIKKDGEYRLNPNIPVEFGIFDIRSLKVYELSTGVYLIVIQTNSGQTYLSGYLSTNETPIFATFQITSNLEQKQFQSFEHVSGTVFKCFFSDRTEKTFSIESNLYATIKEVLNA